MVANTKPSWAALPPEIQNMIISTTVDAIVFRCGKTPIKIKSLDALKDVFGHEHIMTLLRATLSALKQNADDAVLRLKTLRDTIPFSLPAPQGALMPASEFRASLRRTFYDSDQGKEVKRSFTNLMQARAKVSFVVVALGGGNEYERRHYGGSSLMRKGATPPSR